MPGLYLRVYYAWFIPQGVPQGILPRVYLRVSLFPTRFTVGHPPYVPDSVINVSYEARTGLERGCTVLLLLGGLFPFHCWSG